MTDIVNIYYDSDETLQKDDEVQAFVKDVCSFGMQDFDYCGKYKQNKSNILMTSVTLILKSLAKVLPYVCHIHLTGWLTSRFKHN